MEGVVFVCEWKHNQIQVLTYLLSDLSFFFTLCYLFLFSTLFTCLNPIKERGRARGQIKVVPCQVSCSVGVLHTSLEPNWCFYLQLILHSMREESRMSKKINCDEFLTDRSVRSKASGIKQSRVDLVHLKGETLIHLLSNEFIVYFL